MNVQMSESFKKTRLNQQNPDVDDKGKRICLDGGPTGMHGRQVVCVYKPKNPKEKSISVNGRIISEEGFMTFGKDIELDKLVGKHLKVSLLTPEQAGIVPAKPFCAPIVPAQVQSIPKVAPVVTEPNSNTIEQGDQELDGISSFSDAPALQVLNKSRDNIENDLSIVDPEPDIELENLDEPLVYFENDIRKKYPEFKDLKLFAKKFDLTARGYEDLMKKLIDGSIVITQAC